MKIEIHSYVNNNI